MLSILRFDVISFRKRTKTHVDFVFILFVCHWSTNHNEIFDVDKVQQTPINISLKEIFRINSSFFRVHFRIDEEKKGVERVEIWRWHRTTKEMIVVFRFDRFRSRETLILSERERKSEDLHLQSVILVWFLQWTFSRRVFSFDFFFQNSNWNRWLIFETFSPHYDSLTISQNSKRSDQDDQINVFIYFLSVVSIHKTFSSKF